MLDPELARHHFCEVAQDVADRVRRVVAGGHRGEDSRTGNRQPLSVVRVDLLERPLPRCENKTAALLKADACRPTDYGTGRPEAIAPRVYTELEVTGWSRPCEALRPVD